MVVVSPQDSKGHVGRVDARDAYNHAKAQKRTFERAAQITQISGSKDLDHHQVGVRHERSPT